MSSLPNGCTQPTGAVLDADGRCLLSDLEPEHCALPCHRNLPDLPIVHDAFDNGLAA